MRPVTAPDQGHDDAARDRWWRWPWAVVAAPVAIFAKGLLGLALYAPGDGNQLYIPWFLVSARSWLSGHLPTWNPWAQAGMPLLGSSQAGALYPPNLVFLALPAVIANNVSVLITFLTAGLGAWLLARRLTGDRVAATVGGLGFGLCAFFFAHIGHQSLIAAAAWLPWMLFGFELIRERLSPGRLVVPALAVALAALSGHSQALFDDLLLFGVYVLASELLGGSARRGDRPRPLRNAALALAAVAAGLALAAAQLLPTAEVAARSLRQGLSYPQAMSYSLPVAQLPMLAFPYLFGKAVAGGPYTHVYGGIWNLTELSGYPGMVILVLAGAGALALRRHRAARALVTLGTSALLLTLGPATPLSHWLYRVPPFGGFRAWGRFIVGFDLALAMLAAYGTAGLRCAEGRRRRSALIAAAGTAVAVGLVALLAPHLGAVARFLPHRHVAPAALLIPCAFALTGVGGAVLLQRAPRAGPLLLAAVIVADSLLSFGAFFDWGENSPSPATYTAELSPSRPFPHGWGGVAPEPGGIGRYLYIGTTPAPIGGDFVALTDARRQPSVNANNVLMSEDWARATDMGEDGSVTGTADLWQPTSHVFDLLRVTTVLLDPRYALGGPGPGSLLTGGVPAGGGLLRYSYDPKLPEAFLVGATQRDGFSRELKAIHGDIAFDPSSVALIDRLCPACPTGPAGAAGSAGAITREAGTAAVTVHAARPALLVVSEAWSPGWVATVGGRRVPVIRVDGLVQGVPVPAGTSRVALTYHAPGLRAGLLVSLGAALAFAVAGAAAWRKQRHSRGKPVAPRQTRSPEADL